jgi:hypothetical protein
MMATGAGGLRTRMKDLVHMASGALSRRSLSTLSEVAGAVVELIRPRVLSD